MAKTKKYKISMHLLFEILEVNGGYIASVSAVGGKPDAKVIIERRQRTKCYYAEKLSRRVKETLIIKDIESTAKTLREMVDYLKVYRRESF